MQEIVITKLWYHWVHVFLRRLHNFSPDTSFCVAKILSTISVCPVFFKESINICCALRFRTISIILWTRSPGVFAIISSLCAICMTSFSRSKSNTLSTEAIFSLINTRFLVMHTVLYFAAIVSFFWNIQLIVYILKKNSFNSGGHQFHRYLQNEQLPLTSFKQLNKQKTTMYGIENPEMAWNRYKNVAVLNRY